MTPELPQTTVQPRAHGRRGRSAAGLLTVGALMVLLALVAPGAGTAFGPMDASDMARLEVTADRTSYLPGSLVRVAAQVAIEPGWHVNSHEPTFDWLIPTTLTFDLPAGWPEARVSYPPHEMQTFSFEEQPLAVYDGEIVLVADLAVPEDFAQDAIEVPVTFGFQACNDTQCLPPSRTTTTLTLAIGPAGEATADEAFFVPSGGEPGKTHGPSDGDPGDPADEDVETSAAALGGDGGEGGPAGQSLFAILALGVLGGLILNAMPCVLPVLSLKVFGLVQSAGEGRSAIVTGGLATGAGILLSFWALAGAAVAARAAGAAVGWGVQFQNPVFVVALLVVVVLFCLNLWGLFEIPLPQSLARLSGSGPREGIAGHLVSGFFATLMATPCSAPFLGTAVGFALGEPAGVIFAVFTAVGFGMALPYLAVAAAPGLAARALPKPGPWMDTLRRTMGFFLAAAAVWLLYVLAAQVSASQRAWIELAMLVLALCVWLGQKGLDRAFLRRAARFGAVAAAGAALAVGVTADTAPAGSLSGEVAGLIDWVEFDLEQAEALAAGGQLVFVDVTADWCFTCKVNERTVLETEQVAGVFERHDVVTMKADWTNHDESIGDFLQSHGRYGIPFYVLYGPDGPHVFGELLTRDGVEEVVEREAG